VGGAFEGLEDILRRRVSVSRVGFQGDPAVLGGPDPVEQAEVLPEDLMAFGLIPELIGRLAVTVRLQDLSLEALVDVLTKPRNALVKQYRELFALEGVELSFSQGVLYEVARRARERRTGARALRSVLERALTDLMYEIPGSEITRLTLEEGDLDEPARALERAQRRKTA